MVPSPGKQERWHPCRIPTHVKFRACCAGVECPLIELLGTNLTNMVWIEQPVGVGYTQGVPDISNEVELGLQLAGFWKNFVTAFGMENFDMYLTGESYAGYYVPYIADAFINANDTTYWNLKGIAINDPIIGDGTNQQDSEYRGKIRGS